MAAQFGPPTGYPSKHLSERPTTSDLSFIWFIDQEQTLSTLHALIIDDQQLNIDVLSMMLKKEGLTSTAITMPRLLAQTLDLSTHIDVVFLDLEFPSNDGFSLLHKLKGDPRLDGVPVVAYTVHTGKIEEARRAGFHSFLAKPLAVQRFPDQLKRILSNQPVWEI